MNKLQLRAIPSLALPLALLATPAAGQTTAPADQAGAADQTTSSNSGIQDIVVTATRQSTNLQDTPIAITAVTSEAMEQQGITSVSELTAVVPNSSFRKSQGVFGPGVDVTIRGIGNRDTSLASEPVVAFYLDDV